MPGPLVDSLEIIPVSDPVVEAHHRIANNLAIIASLIRSELLTLARKAQADAGYTRRLLQQMSLRIDAVSRLHRLLMNTTHGGTVELSTYLREIVDATLDDRKTEIPAVEAIVAERVAGYIRWYQSRAAAPLIATLRTKAEDIRRAELGRLFARLPELDDRQRELIAGMSVSILNRLLHAPMTRLRETAADGTEMSDADLAARFADLAGLGQQLEAQLSRALRPPELRAGDR